MSTTVHIPTPFEARQPLYQRVAEALSRDIQGGVHPIGTMLPTEAELCVRFGVSRQTIREALRLLLHLGMVSRHHGVGTRVERDAVVQHYVQRLASIPDLWQYVKETRRKLLRVTDVVASGARVPLPGDPAARWRMIEGLRFVDSDRKPIAWTQVYVRAPYAGVTDDPDRDAVPIYSLIERHHGVRAMSVRQEIAAMAIDGELARVLRAPAGGAGLSVLRQYVSTEGEVFEVSISIHPADRYRYTMRLDLDYAGGVGPGGRDAGARSRE